MPVHYLPNLLSATRFVLTPFAVWALLAGDDRRALWLCLAAAITDFLDGFTARRLGIASRMGAILDPLADKFMLDVLYGAVWLARGVTLGMLVIARDLIILAGSAFVHLMTGRRDFPPSLLGKISTIVQILWLLAYLAGGPVAGWPTYIALAITALSGLDYIRLGLNMLRQGRGVGN